MLFPELIQGNYRLHKRSVIESCKCCQFFSSTRWLPNSAAEVAAWRIKWALNKALSVPTTWRDFLIHPLRDYFDAGCSGFLIRNRLSHSSLLILVENIYLFFNKNSNAYIRELCLKYGRTKKGYDQFGLKVFTRSGMRIVNPELLLFLFGYSEFFGRWLKLIVRLVDNPFKSESEMFWKYSSTCWGSQVQSLV